MTTMNSINILLTMDILNEQFRPKSSYICWSLYLTRTFVKFHNFLKWIRS